MLGIFKGKAELTLNKYQFAPGETIEGQFKFTLDKPQVARSVGVSFYGLQQTTQMTGGRRSTRTTKIFDFTQPLDGEKEYPAGESVYPFTLRVPENLNMAQTPEGTLAAENALKDTMLSIDYNTVPYTIFTDPQLAGVGFTEDEQMKQMGVCACRTVSFEDVPKAIIMHRTEGMIKMAIHPQTKQILGVHILSPNAGELIAEAMMLVKNKNAIDDVISSMPVFPTLSEAIKIVALSFTKDISKLSCCI